MDDEWEPQTKELFRQCHYILLANPDLTVRDVPQLLRYQEFRLEKLAAVTDPESLKFWREFHAQPSLDQHIRMLPLLLKLAIAQSEGYL